MKLVEFSGAELTKVFGNHAEAVSINPESICSIEELGESLVAINVHSGNRYSLLLPFAEVKARLGIVDEYHLKVSR